MTTRRQPSETHAERLLYLAGLEENKLPRFPALRQVCGNCRGWGEIVDYATTAPRGQCTICQGRGWVIAEVHLEDLLAIGVEIFQCGIDFTLTFSGDCVVSLSIGGNIGERASTPFLALLQCIEKAIEGEKP